VVLLAIFALEEENVAHTSEIINQLKKISYLIFRSRTNLQILLLAVHIAHIFETYLAVIICRDDLRCRTGLQYCWAIQTLVFGIGSLYILQERQKFMKMLKEKHV
jgi:hypothetical protein